MKNIIIVFVSALFLSCNTTVPKPKAVGVDGEPEGSHTSVVENLGI